MVKIVSVEQMRKIEADADASGLHYDELMERAGQATAWYALQMVKHIDQPRITILVGKGNNGGDGLVAARYLLQQHVDVRCYLLEKLDTAPFKAAEEANVFFAYAEDDDGRVLRHMVASADLIIDALFGIGIRLPLRDTAAKVLRGVKQGINERLREIPDNLIYNLAQPHKMAQIAVPCVLAVDCPSGLDCDTGQIDTNALHADETITFIAIKHGQVTFPGAEAVGKLHLAPLGAEVPQDTGIPLADHRFIAQKLPQRTANSNKGTYGKTLIVGGSENYQGAPILSAEAAYRSGCGLVTIGTSSAPGHSLSEVTYIDAVNDDVLENYDALLIGPGWGQAEDKKDLLNRILNSNTRPPLIVDADALNLLAKAAQWWQKLPSNTIITPHPGEMARLTNMTVADVQANRVQIAQDKANTWYVTVVLKGAHTVIATPDQEPVLLPFKSDALATAGTGDVLAGLIAGIVAQGVSPYDAAILGGYVHGLAGELAADSIKSKRSVIASDVITHIGEALRTIERQSGLTL